MSFGSLVIFFSFFVSKGIKKLNKSMMKRKGAILSKAWVGPTNGSLGSTNFRIRYETCFIRWTYIFRPSAVSGLAAAEQPRLHSKLPFATLGCSRWVIFLMKFQVVFCEESAQILNHEQKIVEIQFEEAVCNFPNYVW